MRLQVSLFANPGRLAVKEAKKGASALGFLHLGGEKAMSFQGPLRGELDVLRGWTVDNKVASKVLHVA